jgi:hypothetical protein
MSARPVPGQRAPARGQQDAVAAAPRRPRSPVPDRHEHEAERNAQAITRRGAACSVTPVSADATPSRGEYSREAASPVPKAPGQALDGVTRRFMQRRLGHDFSDVRIHSGEAASQSAQAEQAHAYTVGRHVVFGRDQYAPQTPRGRMLLAHELTHVAQQAQRRPDAPAIVQRVGFGEFFARLVGEGTYSDDELEVYLLRLESQPGIEGTNESDDKARAVVNNDKHKELTAAIRAKLIQEMLDGVTGDDDENAILKILEDATPLDREYIVEQVGYSRLDSKIDGAEHDRLIRLAAGMHRAGKQAVPTTWTLSYAVKGASELRSAVPAIQVLALDATPTGEAAGRAVSPPQTIQSPSGSPQFLAGNFDHPRDKGGQGSLGLRVLPVDQNGQPIPNDGSAPEQLSALYTPISFDQRLVNAHVNVSYDRQESAVTTENSKAHAAEKGRVTEVSQSQTQSSTNSTGSKQTSGTATSTGTESGRSDTKSDKQGQSGTTSQSQTQGQTQGQSMTHQDNSSTTDTNGKSTTDANGSSTGKTTGNSTTDSNEKSHTDASRTHKQINIHLEGSVEGNLGDLLKKFVGKTITGPILDKFLGRAGKPGALLKRLINKFNPIDMLLEGVGDSFTLKGTLKSDMAFEWETNVSDTTTTGKSTTQSSQDTEGTSKEHSEGSSQGTAKTTGTQDSSTTSSESSDSRTKGRSDTQSRETERGTTTEDRSRQDRTDSNSRETSAERSDTTSATTGSAQRDSRNDTDTTGSKVTERRWIPVIKDSSLTFTVK